MDALYELIKELRKDEGFEGYQYDDHLGFPTIGIGTKLPLTEEEAVMLCEFRLKKKARELVAAKPIVDVLPLEIKIVLLNMAYQMGVSGLLEFRKMWAALERGDFPGAAEEGRDSLWNKQTPSRSTRLMDIMEHATYKQV